MFDKNQVYSAPIVPTPRIETDSGPFPNVDTMEESGPRSAAPGIMPLKRTLLGRAPSSPRPTPTIEPLAATGVRRKVVKAGDLRADVGFQNDINKLLAILDTQFAPFVCAARPLSRTLEPALDTDLGHSSQYS